MAQPKNMSNKSYITFLERALKEEKNPDKKPNINACLKKARETTEAIGQEQVLWAVNGKDAFISNRLEQIKKVHRDHKAELSKVFAVCLTGSTAMMAGEGSTGNTGSPQTRGAVPVSRAPPAPAAGTRTQSPAPGVRGQSPAAGARGQSPAAGVRGQSPAAGVRGQSPAPAARATQQIPIPTEDEKKAVALYTVRFENQQYGMHRIWAKIRMHVNYEKGQNEVNIDINYDTGSTAQGVPTHVLEQMIGKNQTVGWYVDTVNLADGSRKEAYTGVFQIRLFTDPARTIPMADWFDAYGRINEELALSGGEMRFRSGLTFANLPGISSPLIVGASKPAVIYHMFNAH